jgi:hypothetical protein
MGHFGALNAHARCLAMFRSLIRTLSLAVCLQVGWGVAHAQPETPLSEGSQVEHFLSITHKTWGSKRPLLELPLPPGSWTLRHIEKRTNTKGQYGLVFWLDQVQDGEVVALFWASVWENGGQNWVNFETGCTGPLLIRAREPGLDGGCFSLGTKTTMSDLRNEAQNYVREKWDLAGLKRPSRAVTLDGFFEKRSGAVLYIQYSLSTRALGIPDSMSLTTSPERMQALVMAVQAYQEGSVERWFRGYGESVNEQVMLSPSDRRVAATDRPPILGMLKTAITVHLSEEDRRLAATVAALPKADKGTPRALAAPPLTATPQAQSQEELERIRAELAALREEVEQSRRQQAADEAKKAEKPPERTVTALTPPDPVSVTVKSSNVVIPPAPAPNRPKPPAQDVRGVISSRAAASSSAKGSILEVREPLPVKPAASSSPRTPIPEIREVQPRTAPLARKKPEQDIPEIRPVTQNAPKIPL